MDIFANEIWQALGSFSLRLIGALLVLLVGWLIARIVTNLVRRLLRYAKLDERAAGWAKDENVPAIEDWIAKIVYYIAMVFVLIGFFEVLDLAIVTQPLNSLLNVVLSYAPSLLAAALLALIAWIAATILRGLTRRVLEAAKLDSRLGAEEEPTQRSISEALSEGVYWLVWLIALPPILEALGLESLVAPLTSMFNKVLAFVPNIVAAAVILVVGWFVANVVRRIVTGFLDALGADGFGERVGITRVLGERSLSGLLGQFVFVLVLLPIVIASLDALQLTSLTDPMTNMLGLILEAIPAILGAFVILAVATVIGRLVGDLVANLLAELGFDNIMVSLGLTSEIREGTVAPTHVVRYLVMVAIILLGTLSATSLLNFPALTGIVTEFIDFAWNILIGLIIFGLGVWLAMVISKGIESSGIQQKRLAAIFARTAVIVFATSMALGQMGLAASIVNLAFGLLLGAVAVAAAIAFGLGGREIAGRELKAWVDALHVEGTPPQTPSDAIEDQS